MKIPFGIAQTGKAFRNEIVARQFIFRMREFEQMEMQFLFGPAPRWTGTSFGKRNVWRGTALWDSQQQLIASTTTSNWRIMPMRPAILSLSFPSVSKS